MRDHQMTLRSMEVLRVIKRHKLFLRVLMKRAKVQHNHQTHHKLKDKKKRRRKKVKNLEARGKAFRRLKRSLRTKLILLTS